MFRNVAMNVFGFMVIASSIALSACGHLQLSQQTAPQDIEALIEQKGFAAAQKILRESDSSAANYPKPHIIKKLNQHIWTYERDVIRQAVRHENRRQWEKAEQVFKNGLVALPNSQIIRAAQNQFMQRQTSREATLRTELLINKGERLLKDERTYKQITDLSPNDVVTRLKAQVNQQQQRSTAKRLYEQGQLSMQRKDYRFAHRCLRLASRLGSNSEIERALKLASQKINQQRTRVAQKKRTSPYLHVMLVEYKRSVASGDLLRAQQQMRSLQKQLPNNVELQILAAELAATVSLKVMSATEKGKTQYSEGEIQQALSTWQAVLPLDPNNIDLQANIARAERVLQNIRLLKEKQSS